MSLGSGLWPALILAAAVRAQQPLIEFRIEDQFQREHTHEEFAGQAVLLLWADRKGHDHVDAWKHALRARLAARIESGTLNLRGVAHVAGAPFFVKARIRKKFDREPRAWALLDWKGVVRDAYRPPEEQVTLLLFDREHRLAWRQSATSLDSALLDSVVARAEALTFVPMSP
jgi:hypothetical protein